MEFEKHLKKAKIDEDVIKQIVNVDYPKDNNPKQDMANFMAAALHKSEELLDYDKVSEVMFNRACCKTGIRLNNSKKFAEEYSSKSIEEKLKLLGNIDYMGKPFLNENGDIEVLSVETNGSTPCPCWQIGGNNPVNETMPLSYCKCCGGHFRFHYQKALNLKLRLKKVVSSLLDSKGKSPCVFIFEII